MAGGNTVQRVTAIVQPVVESLELMLWDVRFEKEGPEWFLRIFIDKAGNVDLNDCERVSRAVDPLIEAADPIDKAYYLEVSSAGLGRKLTKQAHFDAKTGELVLAHLIQAIDGVRDVEGMLRGRDEKETSIETAQGVVKIENAKISYVKLQDDKDLI